MKTYSFIINPNSGKGKGRQILPQVEAEILKRSLKGEVRLTNGIGHAVELSRNAVCDVVVAIGGDGTINEVANGIIGSSKTLGVIPNGSGNDLVKSLGISSEFPQAMQTLVDGKVKHIDYGSVTCSGADGLTSESRYFVNGVGIGFDAAVAEQTQRIKFVSGTLVYILAVFKTLGKYKSPEFTIYFDSRPTIGRNLLIAIGNGRCVGGGFYLTPNALLDDGLFDVCCIGDISIPKILKLMPKIMRGIHLVEDNVVLKRARVVSVDAPQPFFVHADGEMVGRNVTNVEVSMFHRSLNVIAK